MKTCFGLSLLALVLLWATCQPTAAQPVQDGFAVGTCYSGQNSWPPNPNGYVMGLMDVRQANSQPLDQNWAPTAWHGPLSGEWRRSNLGEVFGICFDPQGNIYVSATIVYGNATPGGPGGSGAIYKIHGVTGNITTFATLPNSGNVGLGNIAWDVAHNQMFATNFEDGKIYRISSAGTVLDAYDPFNDDVSSAGMAPYGDLVWGIGVYNNRVYFGRWVENTGNASAISNNEIWSIPITVGTGNFIGPINGAGDYTNNETLTFTMPVYTSNWSNPVSDIAFSQTGRMLTAERTVQLTGAGLFSAGWPAHDSRVLEFVPPGWGAGNTFSIGAYTNYLGMQSNSAGGVDYAYDHYDEQTRRVVGCDEAMWASGDALHLGFPYSDVIYGWQWLPASGGNVTNSVLVDADGNTASGAKTQIGDIEIYKKCEQPHTNPCQGIQVSLQDQGDCCYKVTISGVPVGSSFTSVTGTMMTAGVTFTGVIGPTGWGVTNSGTTATWNPPSGVVPAGTTGGLEFCVSTTVSAPQQVLITLQAKDGTICEYILDLNCEPPPPGPCVVINDEEIECKGNGPNGWTYDLSFTVTNYSPFSQSPWNLPAANLLVSGTGFSVTPMWTSLVPTLNYGATSGTLNYSISGTGLHPGDTVCLMVQLHGARVGDDFRWCCPPEEICFVLPPCHDCCDTVDIRFTQNSGRQVGNTAATLSSGSVTVTPGPITKAQASIMSVSRSRVWCPDANNVYVPVSAPTTIGALITGASISPTMPVSAGLTPPTSEVIWGTVYSGAAFNPGSINLNLAFPGTSLGWRCQDTLTVCVRYTFTDTACRTCDTVVYYTVPRCGRIDIAVPDKDVVYPSTYAEQVQGGGISIGEPLYSEVVEGPGLQLSMTSLTQGTLSIVHWWQGPVVAVDKTRLVRVKVTPEPGIDIATFREQGGVSAEIINRTATLALDLNEGETDNFNITFNNPTDADFFALRIRFDYVDLDDEDNQLLSREYVVYGDLNGSQGRISVDESDQSTPILYKLLIGSNSGNSADWIAPATFRFTPPQGVRILASGPMPDSTSAEFHLLKSMSTASSMLLQLPNAEEFRRESIAERQSVALWLVLEGGGNIFDLDWEALNIDGEVIGSGDVELSPTSTVRDGDEYVPGASIHLLESYPNPAQDRVTTRFNLARTEKVSVGLYDLSGREISRLVDGVQLGAGAHEYDLNVKGLASGTYYIRLTTSAGTQTRSVIKQ